MAIGKRLLVFSARDPKAASLLSATTAWGCLTTTCESIDDLRGRIEGSEQDVVLVEPSSALKKLFSGVGDEDTLKLPLAEVEKRHIMRVLASTGGNKTRAARILGIDTKTLYNKLKSYRSSEVVARRLSTGSVVSSAV
jgi:DNA-binding NtrC family response regulator